MPKGKLIRFCPTTQNLPQSFFGPMTQWHTNSTSTLENGGFEIGRVSRPTRGWSGIDLFSGDLLE